MASAARWEGRTARYVLSINLVDYASAPASTSTAVIGIAAIDLESLHQVIVGQYASDSCWMLLEHLMLYMTSDEGASSLPSVAAVLLPSGQTQAFQRMQRDVMAFFSMADREADDDREQADGNNLATSSPPTPELFALSRSMFNEAAGREKLLRAACRPTTAAGLAGAATVPTVPTVPTTTMTADDGSGNAGAIAGAFNALTIFLEEKMQLGGGWLAQPNSLVVKDVSSTSMTMDLIPDESLVVLNVFRRSSRNMLNAKGKEDFLSLYDFLSPHFITKPGAHLLRANLKQPLLDVEAIRRRQDAVAELIEDQTQLIEVQTALRDVSRTMSGVDVLCRVVRDHAYGGGDGSEAGAVASVASVASAATTSTKILSLTSSLIQLHEFCQGLNLLEVATASFKSKPLAAVRSMLEKSMGARTAVGAALSGLFESHVLDSFTGTDTKKSPFMGKSQQIFALKATQDTRLLDIHRSRFTASTERVKELAARLRASFPAECGGLSVKYSTSRGFYFCINTGGARIPAESGLKSLTVGDGASGSASATAGASGTQQVTCEELNALNMRIETASNECLRITRDVLLARLSLLLHDHLGPLDAMRDAIAELDVLSGLASFAMYQESECRTYVRPLITRSGPALVVQDGRHPMLERQLQQGGGGRGGGRGGPSPDDDGPFVANDTMLAEESNACILTGSNMTGKSCYLKQNALLVILAQIGAHVPASFMSVTPFGGVSVIKETNSARQMRQVARMLESIRSRRSPGLPGASPRPSHLVLIDEVGDVASDVSTLALSWALVEELLVSNTKAIIATHVTGLGRLCDLYPNCQALMVDAARKIRPGSVCDAGYGIDVARQLGFPASTVDTASRISGRILAQVTRNVNIEEHVQLPRERAVLKAASRMACLRELRERGMLDEAGWRDGEHRVRDALDGAVV